MTKNTAILKVKPLRLPWETQDPFIFCSYHLDKYPGGNEELGSNTNLNGRNIGIWSVLPKRRYMEDYHSFWFQNI